VGRTGKNWEELGRTGKNWEELPNEAKTINLTSTQNTANILQIAMLLRPHTHTGKHQATQLDQIERASRASRASPQTELPNGRLASPWHIAQGES